MQKRIFFIIILEFIILLSYNFSVWAIPRYINYQGELTDQNDQVLNGSYNIIFRLFAVEDGGTSFWSEQHTAVLNDGIYNVQLGSVIPFPSIVFDKEELYLELEMETEGEILYPRLHITAVAFSIKAENADTIDNIHVSDSPEANKLLALDSSGQFPASVIPDDITITETDPTVNDLAKAPLSCTNEQIIKWNGTTWVCTDNVGNGTSVDLAKLQSLVMNDFHNLGGVDQDTQLSDINIGAMGYIKGYTETDPTVSASVKDGISWDEVLNKPASFGGGYSLDAADGSPLDAVYVNNEGNVGIGTTSPGEKLSVAGTIESTSGGFKFPDGSVQTTAVSGGGFGAWASRSADTVYQAATEGFVLVTSIMGQDKHVYGYTDGSNPPTTLRIHDVGGGGGSHIASLTMPVRKNDYWRATGHVDFIYWIPVTAASGGEINHNAGLTTLLGTQNYTIDVTTNLGHKPKIVEITMSTGVFGTGLAFSQAKWVDEDQDGLGVLTMQYTDETFMPKMFLGIDTQKIGRIVTGISEAQDFKVETFDNTIRISKSDTYGNPSFDNMVTFTWYVE